MMDLAVDEPPALWCCYVRVVHEKIIQQSYIYIYIYVYQNEDRLTPRTLGYDNLDLVNTHRNSYNEAFRNEKPSDGAQGRLPIRERGPSVLYIVHRVQAWMPWPPRGMTSVLIFVVLDGRGERRS